MTKESLFTGWNFMRWLRLGLGILIAMQALESRDPIMGLISGLLLFQAITNTGCCGVNGCDVSPTKKTTDQAEDVNFEEVKIK